MAAKTNRAIKHAILQSKKPRKKTNRLWAGPAYCHCSRRSLFITTGGNIWGYSFALLIYKLPLTVLITTFLALKFNELTILHSYLWRISQYFGLIFGWSLWNIPWCTLRAKSTTFLFRVFKHHEKCCWFSLVSTVRIKGLVYVWCKWTSAGRAAVRDPTSYYTCSCGLQFYDFSKESRTEGVFVPPIICLICSIKS